ncbi:MAG: MoaD/ThiS family protein [Chloroflexi bacterium]|nr:MoaD/ThiS family protein [Chloroflexota bacterium]
MPTIKIPTTLRHYTEGKSDILVEGKNVAEALDSLCQKYPSLKKNFFRKEGLLEASIQIVLNKNLINDLQGNQTPLKENDILRILPTIAGGK